MKAFKTFFANTVIGGIFFLMPLFVIVYVVKKTYTALEGTSEKIVGFIGFQKIAGISVGPFVTVALFVLICFAFGLLARLSFAGRMRDWTENSIKSVYPAYDYYKATLEHEIKSRREGTPAKPAVLVRQPVGWQPGVLIQEYATGEKVVFLPLSPKTTDGTVLVVSAEDIQLLNKTDKELNEALLEHGEGLL
jgi:uncharacterized membrane protein